MKPYFFHREADTEFLEALRYYHAISPDLGGRFLDEINRLIHEIRLAPLRQRIIRQQVRRHLGRVFPYALLYVDRTDGILILAVMHGRRKPGYWQGRL